jgi:uncharacterized protein YjbI with pentapeptide repeats
VWGGVLRTGPEPSGPSFWFAAPLNAPHRSEDVQRAAGSAIIDSTMPAYVYVLIGVAAVAGVAIHRLGWSYVRRRFRWSSRTGFRGKTLWDWLQLLVIPLALAAIALGFNFLQSDREAKREDARKERELAIAAKARAQDAQIAADARRDEALTAYLARMEDLTLQHHLTSHPSKDVALLARTLTLTVLRRLDGRRKVHVIQYLADAGLIRHRSRPLSLVGADLRDLDMRNTTLTVRGPGRQAEAARHFISLYHTDLEGADFRHAHLANVNLEQADLRGANFERAVLSGVDLRGACLTNARFHAAQLFYSNLSRAVGYDVDFTNSIMAAITVKESRMTALEFHGMLATIVGPEPGTTSVSIAPSMEEGIRGSTRRVRKQLEPTARAPSRNGAAPLPARVGHQPQDDLCDSSTG